MARVEQERKRKTRKGIGMKQRIFSKGQGWYISATNYKDQEDKCYINLYFPKQTAEPLYHDNGRGFSSKDIDIEEAKFTCYKGKAGLTVFKYTVLEDSKPKQDVDLSPADLPFF